MAKDTEEAIDIFSDLVRRLLRYLRNKQRYMSDDKIEYFIDECKNVITIDSYEQKQGKPCNMFEPRKKGE